MLMTPLVMLGFLLYHFIIDRNMPPKKYTMDKLDKKFDEKLTSFKCDLVSDLKKEIMNVVKAILSEKEKEIEVLKSEVTLLQNHVSTVKHALDKKIDELEQYGKRACLLIECVEQKVNEKSDEVLEKVINIIKEPEAEIPESFLIELIALAQHILTMVREKDAKHNCQIHDI